MRGSSPATGSAPGDSSGAKTANGDVVYIDDGVYYRVKPDGTGVRVTDRGHWMYSPDGTKAAFSKKVGRHHDLFLVNADGSGLVRLTHTRSVDEFLLSWSHDSKRLLFDRSRQRSGPSGFAIMRAKKGAGFYFLQREREQFAGDCPDGGYTDAQWSPTRDEVALMRYCRTDEDEIVLVHPSRKTVIKRLKVEWGAIDPAYDPTGNRIAYGYGSAMSAVDRETGMQTEILPRDSNRPYVNSPVWSPDGRQLVYWQSHSDSGSDVGIVGADGSNPRILVASTSYGGAKPVAWWPAGR